jgi:bifunctional non-homologous end joining protein LigD
MAAEMTTVGRKQGEGQQMGDVFAGITAAEAGLLVPDSRPTWMPAMLATLTDDRFDDPAWIFEHKWDGIRCLAFRVDGVVRLLSRNQLPMNAAYPEIVDALSTDGPDLVIDGEIVAFQGRVTSFERLQSRSGISDPGEARATGIAVSYCTFDLLHLDGQDARQLPVKARKRLLRNAVEFAEPLRYTSHRVEAGIEAYQRACRLGQEGVIAKRLTSTYAGGRSKDWLKFKCVRDQELVIGGFTAPKGSRTGFGALLLGYYQGSDLIYAGKVGTGFDTKLLTSLHARMQELEQADNPFARPRVREHDVHWIRPELVAQIAFSEWTRDGALRHPRFQGLRSDKAAQDVVREQK